MSAPIYITCFNAPLLCRQALSKLAYWGHLSRHHVILSDQSDDFHHSIYKTMAEEFRCKIIRHENKGATTSKRSVLRHAWENGDEIIHQFSEDFQIGGGTDHCVVQGVGSFLEDSEKILGACRDLDFMKWNILTSHNGDMSYMWRGQSWFGGLSLRAIPQSRLMFAVGTVQFSNWPATWRVSGVNKIWDAADAWIPPDENALRLVRGSGGEWAASHCGVGKGAVLLANPMWHPERIKPSGSLG